MNRVSTARAGIELRLKLNSALLIYFSSRCYLFRGLNSTHVWSQVQIPLREFFFKKKNLLGGELLHKQYNPQKREHSYVPMLHCASSDKVFNCHWKLLENFHLIRVNSKQQQKKQHTCKLFIDSKKMIIHNWPHSKLHLEGVKHSTRVFTSNTHFLHFKIYDCSLKNKISLAFHKFN